MTYRFTIGGLARHWVRQLANVKPIETLLCAIIALQTAC